MLGLIADELVVEGVVRAENVPTHNPRLDAWLHERFTGAEFTTRPHARCSAPGPAGQGGRPHRSLRALGNVGLYVRCRRPPVVRRRGRRRAEEYASRI
ncbi:hypothetical protein GCM10023238_32510 [Streptomyces heliomycini]